jgi:RHS repeat-associated protein
VYQYVGQWGYRRETSKRSDVWHRPLDRTIGNWLSSDPVSIVGEYVYCNSRPLTYVDPRGLTARPPSGILSKPKVSICTYWKCSENVYPWHTVVCLDRPCSNVSGYSKCLCIDAHDSGPAWWFTKARITCADKWFSVKTASTLNYSCSKKTADCTKVCNCLNSAVDLWIGTYYNAFVRNCWHFTDDILGCIEDPLYGIPLGP